MICSHCECIFAYGKSTSFPLCDSCENMFKTLSRSLITRRGHEIKPTPAGHKNNFTRAMMNDPVMVSEYPDPVQRSAIAETIWRANNNK